jgi:hypothetical protein
MSVELIYKTTDPAVLAWWESVHQYHDEIWEQRNAYAERITAELGKPNDWRGVEEDRPRRLYEMRLYRGGSYLDGVEATVQDRQRPSEELLALGWRVDSKTRKLAPAKRTEAGKAIVAEWNTLSVLNREEEATQFGVTPEFRGPTRDGITNRYFAGFTVIGDAFYVTYGSSYGEKSVGNLLSKSAIDWTRLTTSEWRDLVAGTDDTDD